LKDEFSHFSNSFASDEIQPFESDEKYELVEKIQIGKKKVSMTA
jgi:hypothetical protein|tara:strand:+ start:160 stop:291 length:132 start_codon:yes stop_codon:yes gene_type:complete